MVRSRDAVADFVERYNQTWRLEKLGYQTPIEAREEYELSPGGIAQMCVQGTGCGTSAAKTTGLSERERDFAISFGLENAERWHPARGAIREARSAHRADRMQSEA